MSDYKRRSVDELLEQEKVHKQFKTLFHGQRLIGSAYSALFSSSSNVAGTPLNNPIINVMNALDVRLFGWGPAASLNDYVFTVRHLLVYKEISRWEIVNNPPKYDGTDIWECKWGELEDVIPWARVESIESKEGNRYHSWAATKVQEERSPLVGAVVGGAIAGTTGAVIGALANSGTKERIIVPSGSANWDDISIIIKTDQGRKYTIKVASTVQSNRDKQPRLNPHDYGNRINSALTHGMKFTGQSVKNGSALQMILSTLAKYIDVSKKMESDRKKADQFWESHLEEKRKLDQIFEILGHELDYKVDMIKLVNQQVNNHVQESTKELEEKSHELTQALNSAGLLKSIKLRKDYDALRKEIDKYKADKDFDSFMIEKHKELNVLIDNRKRIEEMYVGVYKLISGQADKDHDKYLGMIMDHDFIINCDINDDKSRLDAVEKISDYLSKA